MSFNFNYALMDHYKRIDAAVKELADLWRQGVDVNDNNIYYEVLARNGLLNDGFTLNHEDLVKQVNRRIGR